MLRVPAGAVRVDRELERELNVTLINRGHSFEGLTTEGERLVVWAKRIHAEHNMFKTEVDAVRSGITGTLRLGTVHTASTTASLVLSAFCATHPLAKVQIHSRLAATELYRRLREFELDAAIVHASRNDAQDVSLVPLYAEHYVLLRRRTCCPPGRPRCRGGMPRGCRCIDHPRYAGPSDHRRDLRRARHHRRSTGRD